MPALPAAPVWMWLQYDLAPGGAFMLLWQSVHSFFRENKVLSCLFVILLTVCLVGSYFGVNYVLCQAYEYNLYQIEQRTFTLTEKGNGIPAISPMIEAYPDDTAISS